MTAQQNNKVDYFTRLLHIGHNLTIRTFIHNKSKSKTQVAYIALHSNPDVRSTH